MRFIVVCVLILLSWQAQAQSGIELLGNSKIYLKDGSVIIARVKKIMPRKILAITSFGLKVHLHKDDILKAEYIENSPSSLRTAQNNLFSFDRGFYHWPEAMIGTGADGLLAFTYSLGKRLGQYKFLGGGTGIISYEPNEGKDIIPLFAEWRGFLNASSITPFYAAKAGVGFGQRNNFNIEKGGVGFLFGLDFGVRFGGYKSQFALSLGYRHQNMKWDFIGDRIQERVYRRTGLQFGLVF